MVSVSTPYRGFDTLTPSSLMVCNQGVGYCQRLVLTPSDTLTPSDGDPCGQPSFVSKHPSLWTERKTARVTPDCAFRHSLKRGVLQGKAICASSHKAPTPQKPLQIPSRLRGYPVASSSFCNRRCITAQPERGGFMVRGGWPWQHLGKSAPFGRVVRFIQAANPHFSGAFAIAANCRTLDYQTEGTE